MDGLASRNWFSLAESGWVPCQFLQRRFHNGSRHFFFGECRLIANQDGARQFRLSSFGDSAWLKRPEQRSKPFDNRVIEMNVRNRSALFLFTQSVVFVLMMMGLASPAVGQARTGETVIQKATEQFEDSPLTITSLSPGLYVFSGDGGNVTAIVD